MKLNAWYIENGEVQAVCITDDKRKLDNTRFVREKRGKWKIPYYRTGEDHNFSCSLCNYASRLDTPFCPNCGAKMRR